MNAQEKLNRVPAPGFNPAEDWTKLPLAIIDFETTGLDPSVNRIIEYGIVLIDEGKVDRSEDYFVRGGFLNPGVEISQEITDITGITNEQLKDAPTFEEAYDIIEDTLCGRVPVAYNADFDRDFLLHEVYRVLQKKIIDHARRAQHTIITPEFISEAIDPDELPAAFRQHVEWIDPLVWVRKIHKFKKGKKTLSEMCSLYGIEIQAHRATADAEATAKLLLKMAPRINIPAYFTLIQEQKQLAVDQEREFQAYKLRQCKT
jgi:DNA polymerase III epsilon subunit-like protein